VYCRKCYAKLDGATHIRACPQCLHGFDPADARTYLVRGFPSAWRIVGYVVATTVISIGGAFVVALFQMGIASGH